MDRASTSSVIPPRLRGGWPAAGRPGGVFIANETRQEVELWVHLRSWRQRGFHFRRQSPREGFIVDFICLRQKLVVEVDGGQHNFDDHAARDRHFTHDGFRVLRFWNSDVDRNLISVLETIDAALQSKDPHPVAFGDHPPPSGEG